MTEPVSRRAAVPAVLGVLSVAVLGFGVALIEGRLQVGPLPVDAITTLVPLAIVALVPLARRSGTSGLEKLGLLAPLLAFLALQLVSVAMNGFGSDMLATSARYTGYGALMLIVALVARERATRHWLMWIVLAVGVAVSLIGIGSYVQMALAYLTRTGAGPGSLPSFRITSTFQNANFLGEYLVIVIGAGLALAFAERRGRRVLALAGTLVCGLALVLTYTRGSWLALAIALSVALLAVEARYFWGLVVVGVAGGLVVPGFLPRLASSFSTQGTAGFRMRLWRIAGEAIAEHPLAGWGPGRFYDAFSATVAAHPELGVGYSMYGAHNSYFTLLAETGLIGGLAFLALVASVVRSGVRAVARATEHAVRLEAAALTAGLGGFALNALTSNSFQHPQPAVFFWLVAGLLGGLALEVDALALAGAAAEAKAPGRWVAGSRVVQALAPVRSSMRCAWQASGFARVLLSEPRVRAALLDTSLLVRLVFGRPGRAEEAER